MDKNLPIGVFDSGAGGLTVLNELVKLMPYERYIYIADLKNSPYGNKSFSEIEDIVDKIFEKLAQKVKLIVVACNTASSLNIDEYRKKYNIPIFTILESAVNSLDKEYSKILLAATEATVKIGKYEEEIKTKCPSTIVYAQACPEIVNYIENLCLDDEVNQRLVDSYIKKYEKENVDLVLLGCTHYPLWSKYFRNSLNKNTRIYDPANYLAQEVFNYLTKNSLLNKGKLEIVGVVSDKLENFKKNIDLFVDNYKFTKYEKDSFY